MKTLLTRLAFMSFLLSLPQPSFAERRDIAILFLKDRADGQIGYVSRQSGGGCKIETPAIKKIYLLKDREKFMESYQPKMCSNGKLLHLFDTQLNL